MDPISLNKLGGPTFICTECGQGFSLYSDLLNHLIIHGPLDSFSLDGSSNGFDVAREYMLHENGTLTVVERSDPVVKPPSPTLPKPLPPYPVLQPTSRFKSIEATFKVQTPTPVNCRCETCNKSFNSLRSLQKHQQYRKTEEGHKCTLCCKVFADKEELKGHLQEHAHERFYCCGHCGKRFLKLETLYAHQKERHQSPVIRSVKKSGSEQQNGIEKTYPCKKCRLHFFWLSDLQSHSLSHTKDKDDTEPPTPEIKTQPLPKENAPNSFDNSCDSSNDNNDNDENDLSFNVKNDNGKAFSGTATQFRPYRCGLCGDRFQQLADLKKHHFSHQTQTDIDQTLPKRKQPATPPTKRGRPRRRGGPKLHPCKYCHRAFNHSSSLSRHMRYHKGTLHTCVFCGRHFPQRCDVRRHIKLYHKKELKEKPSLKYKALNTRPERGPKGSFFESETSGRRRRKYKDTSDIVDFDSEDEETTSKRSKARVNYKCQECGKRFGLLCVYQRHLRYHKRQPSDELLKCPRCPSRFQESSALKLHLDNHPDQLDEEVDMEGQTSPTGSSQEPDQENDKVEVLEDEEDMGHPVGDQGASGKVLYECTECTENFSCLQKFLQHQTSHGSDNIG